MTRNFKILVAAGLLAATGSAAQADSMVKFYTNGSYSGPFSGAGTVYNALIGTATACSGSCTTSDVISSSILFNGTGITASASKVWWDLSPPNGGLGVGTGPSGHGNAGDDNINLNEVLELTFSSVVTLTGVATLFDTTDHGPFVPSGTFNPSTVANKDFLICAVTSGSCTPSTEVKFGTANDMGLNLVGKDFFFTVDPSWDKGDIDYYVSGLTYRAVPGPLAGAGFPGLTLLGGGILAWWRRKTNSKAALA
jgi:hypothetical protein